MDSSDERETAGAERYADSPAASTFGDAVRGMAGTAGARLSDLGTAYAPPVGARRAGAGGFGSPPGRSREEVGRAVRRGLAIGAGLLALLLLLPSMVTYINPGHVGIVIHRAGGGVDKTPLGPGLHPINPLFTAIEEYPTFMQTLVLTRATTEGSQNNDEINVNSVEGQPLSLDVSMSFELEPTRVPALYQTFRTDIDVDLARLPEAVHPPGAAGDRRLAADRRHHRPEARRRRPTRRAGCSRSGCRPTGSR